MRESHNARPDIYPFSRCLSGESCLLLLRVQNWEDSGNLSLCGGFGVVVWEGVRDGIVQPIRLAILEYGGELRFIMFHPGDLFS